MSPLPDNHRTPPHASLAALLCVLILAKGVIWLLWGGPKLIWDSYWYLYLAQSLAEHSTYRLADGAHHLKYLPGYPILIALVSLLTPSYELAGGLISLLASVIGVVLVYRIGNSSSSRAGLLAACIFGLHHLSLVHSNLILTEHVFSVLCLAALWSAVRGKTALGILLSGCASLVRYEGVLLLAILIFKSRKSLFSKPVLAALSFVLVGWLSWVSYLSFYAQQQSGYFVELQSWEPLRALDFLLLSCWLGILLLITAALGVTRVKKNAPVLFGYAAPFYFGYLLIHLSWWFTDVRFYVPLLPMIALCAAAALDSMLSSIATLRSRAIAGCLALVILGIEQLQLLQPQEFEYRRYNTLYLAQYAPIEQLTRWIRTNLPDGDFAAPEQTVYQWLLPSRQVRPYSSLKASPEGLPRYVIIDSIHFDVPSLQSGLEGSISLPEKDGAPRAYSVRVLHEATGAGLGQAGHYAAVLEIEGR